MKKANPTQRHLPRRCGKEFYDTPAFSHHYLAFISLGLPDALLGAAWPSMQPEFGVPISYAGILSMIIAVGTVVSSLQSDRLTRCLGTGKVTSSAWR